MRKEINAASKKAGLGEICQTRSRLIDPLSRRTRIARAGEDDLLRLRFALAAHADPSAGVLAVIAASLAALLATFAVVVAWGGGRGDDPMTWAQITVLAVVIASVVLLIAQAVIDRRRAAAVAPWITVIDLELARTGGSSTAERLATAGRLASAVADIAGLKVDLNLFGRKS